MKATEFLHKAASLLEERGKQYDQPQGERSMGKAVTAFNAITSRDLSEAEGWLLLQLLKDVRQWQNPERYHADSAEDCVSYAALKAEALAGSEPAKNGMPTGWSIGPNGPVYSVEVTAEPAASIDDESPRAMAIGQNGNTGEHYGENKPDWKDAPEWAKFIAQDDNGRWYWYENEPECDDTGWYDDCGEYTYAQTGTVFSSFEVTLEPRPCQ